ncbi:MAG TPA: cytochrome c [Hanamia sp.]
MDNPSLLKIQEQMNKESVLSKIRQGGGRMPSFASTLKGQGEAIIAYLFENKSKSLSQSDDNLL